MDASRYLSICSFMKKMIVLAAILLIVCFLMPSRSNAEEEFVLPPVLNANVEFWAKVYSQYSTNHVIIHDTKDLSIIYQVVNLDHFYAKDVGLKAKWKKVEQVKNEYRAILDHLSTLKEPILLDSLSCEERHVYILWAQHDEADKFQRARLCVRGQLGLRDRFRESVGRSGAIIDHIVETLNKYDLPTDLAYLPHVESLYNYNSYSKVGAVGLWQFIRHTGRLFMTINSSLDERRDPFSATDAAARLLKLNMDELQSWPLAITAYNHGLTGMKNAVKRTGTDDFGVIVEQYKSRTFGFASRNFYAEFLAARQVAKNYKSYFGEIDHETPVAYQTIKLPQNVYLRQIAELFDIPEDTLVVYNPAFRWNIVKNQTTIPKGYELRMPHRDGYDPREVFVSRTKPIRQQRKASSRRAELFAYRASSDTTNSISESKVLNLLKKPIPSLVDRNETPNENQSRGGM
jgi:membrane-bound lytic murein transglycosylase D